MQKNILKAVGDITQGEGTVGGKPPEAMLENRVKAHASRDVHAVGHILWQLFSRDDLQSQNSWLNPVSDGVFQRIYGLGKSIHDDEVAGRGRVQG